MSTAALSGFVDCIRATAAAGGALRLRGGGTKDFYGGRSQATVLDTRAYRGIVAHDAAELVITARCGTPLIEIEQLLAAHRQGLAFEPPHHAVGATLGGCVAAGLAGPRRASAGALRDYVLGATVMDGQGRVLRFGGQVMKNVAGYDIARLMAGSLGTLAIILDVSLKVLPLAPRESTRVFAMSQAVALRRVNEWAGQPMPISASAWHDGQLYLRLSGALAAIDAAHAVLGGEALSAPAADAFWCSLREQQHAFFSARPADATLWRLALPATSPPILADHATLIEWHGAQRWVVSSVDPHLIRAHARNAGGHAVAFRRGNEQIAVFDALPAAALGIHRRLRAAFDPAAVFDGKRLFPEL